MARPKKVILLVDAKEETLSTRTFLLQTRGYRVLTASSGVQALELLEGCVPEADDPRRMSLLICELLLPGMDGNELARRAKQMHGWLPVLIVSATATGFEQALAADGFLPKGACSAAELLERVQVLIARKRGPKKQVSQDVVTAEVAA